MEQVKQKNAYPSKGMSFADQKGLTKREYFAAMAMQGLMAKLNETDTPKEIAQVSIILADELLKQLEEK